MQNSVTNPDLPLEGKIRFRQVQRLTGFSRPTIWRMGRAGKFPKSVRVTPRLTVWDAAEVRAWIADPIGWAQAAVQS